MCILICTPVLQRHKKQFCILVCWRFMIWKILNLWDYLGTWNVFNFFINLERSSRSLISFRNLPRFLYTFLNIYNFVPNSMFKLWSSFTSLNFLVVINCWVISAFYIFRDGLVSNSSFNFRNYSLSFTLGWYWVGAVRSNLGSRSASEVWVGLCSISFLKSRSSCSITWFENSSRGQLYSCRSDCWN